MKIMLETLQKSETLVDLTIHSFERCIYQARLQIGSQELIICDNKKRPLKRRSLALMREALRGVPTRSLQLAQSSPYDEMIGQPMGSYNAMHIPLRHEQLPGLKLEPGHCWPGKSA